MTMTTDRPRADVEEMVRRLHDGRMLMQLRKDAATLLSQEHERAEDYATALDKCDERFAYIAEHLPKGWEHCTTEKELCEQIAFTEARAEQLERLLSEADAVIADIAALKAISLSSVPGHVSSPLWRWLEDACERHASRASPKQKE